MAKSPCGPVHASGVPSWSGRQRARPKVPGHPGLRRGCVDRKDLPAQWLCTLGRQRCAWSNRRRRIVRRGGHHGFIIPDRGQALTVAVALSPERSGRSTGHPVSSDGSPARSSSTSASCTARAYLRRRRVRATSPLRLLSTAPDVFSMATSTIPMLQQGGHGTATSCPVQRRRAKLRGRPNPRLR
jgi:hypothetical protein